MLFNSLAFLLFLPIVFILYWWVFKKNLSLQNALILVASYVFYGWWDWRFLGLIAASTLVDFLVGKALERSRIKSKRKLLLVISVMFNLGLLGFFKYYNFFVESWIDAWGSMGIQMHAETLRIILPVGISFYTFQTLSYTIDVYRKKLEPTHNLLQFAAYVAFFPQLVAGPIERATRLLPQFRVQRVFNTQFAIGGFYLIVWGLFKKMVVADNCAFFVNQIFEHPQNYSSLELLGGAVLFAFQIYGDFSGYSDIAIGVARLFGFSLMTNFAFPYFSRDIAEFWRRWHISLSTWFRDYLYIPLGGSRGNKTQQIRNIAIVFLVSGFWHGANWTFIVWGGIHALLFLPLLLLQRNRKHIDIQNLNWKHLPTVLGTFFVVTLAWIFFRADSVGIAADYVVRLVTQWQGDAGVFVNSSKSMLFTGICGLSILVVLMFEYFSIKKGAIEVQLNRTTAMLVLLLIFFMGVFKNPSDFIYFQF